MFIKLLGVLTSAIFVFTFYKTVFLIIGLFTKSKVFPETDKKHRFGIVIAARNEEAVIGRLIESIHAQDYDPSLIKIFVVADNCTDGTASICRDMGAVVYERHDPAHARKGYALEFLFEKIKEDYGIDAFDGYIIFDADNLLRENFLTEMNKAFDTGADICIGYRNTKNFDENPISAGYGIHFMRSSMSLHRPRTLFSLNTHIAGTGWAVRSALLSEGWHCTYLTEDTQFTMKTVTSGGRIEYCEAAEFYDEQPHGLRIAVRQRIRWIKGRLSCFLAYAPRLIAGIFRRGTARKRISCYDMFFYLFPAGLFSAFCAVVPIAADVIYTLVRGDPLNLSFISFAKTALLSLCVYWLTGLVTGAAVVIRERRHIGCSRGRLAYLLLLWPWFDLVELPLAVIAIFSHVEWKPIKHDRALSISDMRGGKK